MIFLNNVVFNAVNNAGGQTSSAIRAAQMINLSAQAFFSDGAAAGTLKVQASNDYAADPATFVPTHWSDVPSGSVVVAAGATVLIPQVNICYGYIRLVWTSTGGAGTITATVKSINY